VLAQLRTAAVCE